MKIKLKHGEVEIKGKEITFIDIDDVALGRILYDIFKKDGDDNDE